MPAVQDSDLVIAQRLGSGESAIAAAALRLPAYTTASLQQLDDRRWCVGSGEPEYVRINATDIERGLAGSARR